MRKNHIISESIERRHYQIDFVGLCKLPPYINCNAFIFKLNLQFCLEEEDVWRCVLAWAKHKAIVSQPTGHWTEEERSRVCQYLSGVMGHVRLLLIGECFFVFAIISFNCLFPPSKYSNSSNRQSSICRGGRTNGSCTNGIVT